jgi:hypothetical protein
MNGDMPNPCSLVGDVSGLAVYAWDPYRSGEDDEGANAFEYEEYEEAL